MLKTRTFTLDFKVLVSHVYRFPRGNCFNSKIIIYVLSVNIVLKNKKTKHFNLMKNDVSEYKFAPPEYFFNHLVICLDLLKFF